MIVTLYVEGQPPRDFDLTETPREFLDALDSLINDPELTSYEVECGRGLTLLSDESRGHVTGGAL